MGRPERDRLPGLPELLERKDLDAFMVSTPDHWHAAATMLACQAGKDVYVERPVCHNIGERRKVVEAARYDTGRKLHWDATREEFTGDAEANRQFGTGLPRKAVGLGRVETTARRRMRQVFDNPHTVTDDQRWLVAGGLQRSTALRLPFRLTLRQTAQAVIWLRPSRPEIPIGISGKEPFSPLPHLPVLSERLTGEDSVSDFTVSSLSVCNAIRWYCILSNDMRSGAHTRVQIWIITLIVFAAESVQSADKKAIQWLHGTMIEMNRDTRVVAEGDKVHGKLDPGKSGDVDLTSSKQTSTSTVLVYVVEDEKVRYVLERPVALLGPRAHACDVKVGQAVDFVIQQDTALLKEPNGKECKTWIRSQRMKSATTPAEQK
jgi:hypothetical protein